MSHDLFAEVGETRPAADTVERLFFGLMLPEPQAVAALDVLTQSQSEHGLKGKPLRSDRLHVTLIHIGDYANALPPRVISAMRDAGDSLAAVGFDVAFDQASSFASAPGRSPHVLLGGNGVEALRAFRAELLKAVIRHGVKPLSRPQFTPHVTLSYGDRRLPERPIRPISWRAEEFVLIHSKVGRSTYHTLGRWRLR